jgi:ABC-type nitrate/sulfonate/bicarbonate transport system substrate-binding protein
MSKFRQALLSALTLAALASAPAGTARAEETLTLGLPAIPPVFVSVQAFVAQQEGYFK